MRHCRQCGEVTDDCICGDEEDAAEDAPPEFGWAGKGFRP